MKDLLGNKTYFIADIGANHDVELKRAKDLIKRAKDAGADCAKFQHFQAKSIVSDRGFKSLGKMTHQAQWEKEVFQVYEDYSLNREWNQELADTAESVGIDFMTTPYDFEAADQVNHLVKAFKIGSGDITYPQLITHVARKGKPVFLATGASTMAEVEVAVNAVLSVNPGLCLLQCNTNYTGDLDNFRYINLNVLRSYALHWPSVVLGLSDHTPGHATALGAVALGAKVIEKHFTDDSSRKGPDHIFAMEPLEWMTMVENVRELEMALGDGVKRVEKNEQESVIVQRRALRLKTDHGREPIENEDLEALRPCPEGALTPAQIEDVIGKRPVQKLPAGRELYPENIV
jgi:sialic acid synthase SpsE